MMSNAPVTSPLPRRSSASVSGLLCAGLIAGALAVPAAAAAPVAKGSFGPTAKYTGTGTATVQRVNGRLVLKTSRNFTAQGAISLRLRLSTQRDGEGGFIDAGVMRKSGAQTIRLPRSYSRAVHIYAVAWCTSVSEPITVARLRRP